MISDRKMNDYLLIFSYPSTYINAQFQQFFMKYISSASSSILALIDSEEEFFKLRKQLLLQPTIKQILVNKSAATVDTITNDQNVVQEHGPINIRTMETTTIKQKDNKFKKMIFIHCTHETRLEGLKRQIHEIHDSFFKTTDYGDIRLVVGHRNNPNMEFELVRKRPHSSLLKNLPPNKSKDPSYILYNVILLFSSSFRTKTE